MVNNVDLAFVLSFGIVFLNRTFNLLEQIVNSETPKSGAYIVLFISLVLFIITVFIVMRKDSKVLKTQ